MGLSVWSRFEVISRRLVAADPGPSPDSLITSGTFMEQEYIVKRNYFELGGADADWFERTTPAFTHNERCRILRLACNMWERFRNAPLDRVAIARTSSGTVLRMEQREEDGKVLVTILGTAASFSFDATTRARLTVTGLVWEQDDEATPDLAPEVADQLIADLGIPPRAVYALERLDIHTIGQIVDMSDDELREVKGIGDASIDVIDEKLSELDVVRRKQR